MLRSVDLESLPIALKSLSAAQPEGRAGKGRVTTVVAAMVVKDVVVDGEEEVGKKTWAKIVLEDFSYFFFSFGWWGH